MNETGQKILIVDDDLLLAKSLEKQFTEAGYRVVTAHDGEAGFETFKNERPDIVLMDVMMPKKTGIEMLKDIREKLPESDVPFIVLSSMNEMDKVAEAMSHGARAYLLKSDNQIDEVVTAVEEKLRNA